MSCRRFCHLVLEWLMEKIDYEVWDREYKDLFFGSREKHQRQVEAKKRIAPTPDDKRGTLNIEPVVKIAPEDVDLSAIIGKYGGAKRAPDQGSSRGVTIGTGPDGNLSVEEPERPEG